MFKIMLRAGLDSIRGRAPATGLCNDCFGRSRERFDFISHPAEAGAPSRSGSSATSGCLWPHRTTLWTLITTPAALAILLLGACGTSTKLVTRTPDASLMVPCEKPQPLPAKPTGNVIDKALVNTTRLLLECSAKHDGLIEFERAGPK